MKKSGPDADGEVIADVAAAVLNDKRHLSSLKRGLAALSILNLEGRLTASELAGKIRVPRTTAHRILDTLVAEGYVIHDPHSHCYQLASQVRRLAQGFNRDSLLAEVGRPVLRDLCKDVLTPVGLTTPVGQEMIIQVSMDYEAPLALQRLPEGTSFPVTFPPSGHLFLAHCREALRGQMIEAALDMPMVRRQRWAKAPTNAELDRIRADGYALSIGHNPDSPEGVIAVPVYIEGAFVASIHIRFMKRVVSASVALDRYLAKMQVAAREIEARLAQRLAESPGLLGAIDRPLLLSDPIAITEA